LGKDVGWYSVRRPPLVLIDATPEGKKELVGFQTGVRDPLRHCQYRGRMPSTVCDDTLPCRLPSATTTQL
jgi:hypothetical protein